MDAPALTLAALAAGTLAAWRRPARRRWARRAGPALLVAGLCANVVVVGVDAGMPVDPAAAVAAGASSRAGVAGTDWGPAHHAEGRRDRFTALDDRLPVRPLRSVVSAGDLALDAGAALAALGWVPELARRRRAAAAGSALAQVHERGGPGHGARVRLQVAVEAVEHGAGHRLLDPGPRGHTAAHPAQVAVPQHHEGAVAEVLREDVDRSRFVWHREPEFPEAFDDGVGRPDPVPRPAGHGDAAAAVGEVDLEAVAAPLGRDGDQLHPHP